MQSRRAAPRVPLLRLSQVGLTCRLPAAAALSSYPGRVSNTPRTTCGQAARRCGSGLASVRCRPAGRLVPGSHNTPVQLAGPAAAALQPALQLQLQQQAACPRSAPTLVTEVDTVAMKADCTSSPSCRHAVAGWQQGAGSDQAGAAEAWMPAYRCTVDQQLPGAGLAGPSPAPRCPGTCSPPAPAGKRNVPGTTRRWVPAACVSIVTPPRGRARPATSAAPDATAGAPWCSARAGSRRRRRPARPRGESRCRRTGR